MDVPGRRKTKSLDFSRLFTFREDICGPLWTTVLAEQVGFEPTVRHNRTPDFESGAFDHSATAPEFGSRGAKPVIVADLLPQPLSPSASVALRKLRLDGIDAKRDSVAGLA
jgi:hypothetical protein